MRRVGYVNALTVTASLVVACNALTGVGDLETSDGVDGAVPAPGSSGKSGTSSSTSSASSTSSSSSGQPDSGGSTSSSSSTSGGPAPVTLEYEPFASGCSDWKIEGSGNDASFATGYGGGGSACVLCAVKDGEDVFLVNTVTATRTGKVIAQMYARREVQGATPSSANISLVSGASNTSVGGGIGDDYTLVKNGIPGGNILTGGISVASGAVVTVKVGMQKPVKGDCVVVDDITVSLD